MKRRRKSLWIAGIALAIALAAHLGMAHARQRLEEKRRALEAQLESRSNDVKTSTARLAESEKRLADLRAKASALASAPSPSQKSAAAAKGAAERSGVADLAAIGKDPKLRKASVLAYVDERKAMFAGLFAKLGFTADQMRRFEQIQAGYQEGLLDIADTTADQGFPWRDPGIASLRSELNASIEAQTRALFGDNYTDWMQANWTQNSRQIVGEVLQKSYDGDGAITGEQADRLTQLLADNNSRYQAGQRAADSTSYNWDAILSQASAILTPPQLDAFKTGTEAYRLRVQRSVAEERVAGVRPP